MSSPLFAAIDIGSNTFRLMIARQAEGKHITPWHIEAYTHRIVRLGEGLHQHGRLGNTAMQRALTAFHDFAGILQQHAVPLEHTRIVATAAMREASNGQDFCRRVAQKTGLHLDIIDGDTEARLSLAGAAAVLPEHIRRDFLLFDIGGGSTEFVRACNTELVDAISRKLGVVRLVEQYLRSDPPSQNDYHAMKEAAQQQLEEVASFWRETSGQATPPAALVGTAGTVTTLAAFDLKMQDYDANRINRHSMSATRVRKLRDQLVGMTLETRQAQIGIEPGRADLMIAGVAIIDAILEKWGHERLHIVDAGLLEGAWLSIARQYLSR